MKRWKHTKSVRLWTLDHSPLSCDGTVWWPGRALCCGCFGLNSLAACQPARIFAGLSKEYRTPLQLLCASSIKQGVAFTVHTLLQGYVYILTHPGMPCIFIDHVLEAPGCQADVGALRGLIQTLVSLRRKLRIAATCKVGLPGLCLPKKLPQSGLHSVAFTVW